MNAGKWSNAKASGYLRKTLVRNAFQLRLNAYRVLLTRARDAVIVFVPQLPLLDETFDYLIACGFTPLTPNVVVDRDSG
jgi:Schlafen group 3, DNA/RNA helicase domain